MIHYIYGKLEQHWQTDIIKNDSFGVEVFYKWNTKNWDFFLYPYFDPNNNTFIYYAFDSIKQKTFFAYLVKISWIGCKTAYFISSLEEKEIQKAIQNFDLNYFQKLPGIWPKTAKRLIIEMKSKIQDSDIQKLNIDEDLLKNIIKTLKPYWFDSWKIKSKLQNCNIPFKKDNTEKIIKRLLENYDK